MDGMTMSISKKGHVSETGITQYDSVVDAVDELGPKFVLSAVNDKLVENAIERIKKDMRQAKKDAIEMNDLKSWGKEK